MVVMVMMLTIIIIIIMKVVGKTTMLGFSGGYDGRVGWWLMTIIVDGNSGSSYDK